MPVPEASVDEYCGFVFRQDDVRLAWQVAAIHAKPESHAVQKAAHDQFRLRVLRANPGHVPASLLRCQLVNHASILLMANADVMPILAVNARHNNKPDSYTGSEVVRVNNRSDLALCRGYGYKACNEKTTLREPDSFFLQLWQGLPCCR